MKSVELDRDALRRGIVLAVAIAVPAAVVFAWMPDNRGVLAVFTLVVLGGLVAGAAVASMRQQVGMPLVHGILTALTAFAVVQCIGLVRRLVQDDAIEWGAVVSNLLLSLIAGTIGGLVGTRLVLRHTRSQEPT